MFRLPGIPRVSGGNSVAAKIFEDETGIPRVSGGNSVLGLLNREGLQYSPA